MRGGHVADVRTWRDSLPAASESALLKLLNFIEHAAIAAGENYVEIAKTDD